MIALISDVHSNLPALEAVLADIKRFDVDEIISLGDVAGYFPTINECIELMISHNITNIMGNHDSYLANGVECEHSHTVNSLICRQRQLIKKEHLEWLANSPTQICRGNSSFVHGGWHRGYEEYLYKLSPAYFEKLPYHFYFAGHTHVQCLHKFENGKVFCNPGSVGQPRDGNPSSAYALFHEGRIFLRRIKYDIEAIQKIITTANFPHHIGTYLDSGRRIDGKVDQITVS